jgi:hypothetical protein
MVDGASIKDYATTAVETNHNLPQYTSETDKIFSRFIWPADKLLDFYTLTYGSGNLNVTVEGSAPPAVMLADLRAQAVMEQTQKNHAG